MENSKQIRISLEEILYYLMFSILLFTKGIGLDEGSILFRGCLLCAVALFGLKILIGRYTVWEILIMVLGVLWGIFIFFHVGSLGIFVYTLMLFGMKNMSVSKVFKIGTVVWSGCMLFTITAAVFFNRTGVRLVHEKLGLGPVLRESLGYTHPNVLHISYILLMAFVLYSCKKENAVKTILLLMAGNAFIFMYSMSYTGLLISGVLLVVYLYFLLREKISRIETILMRMILPVCIVVSIICPPFLVPDSILYNILNSLLNNRIWAMKYFFNEYEITLFGEKITLANYSLDNSFIYALAWYGVLFLVVVALAYCFVINKYVKNARRMELVVIISFLFAGLTEQFLFNASIKNITVIFLGEVFFEFMNGKGVEFSIAGKWNRIFEFNRKPVELVEKKTKTEKKSILLFGGMIVMSLLIGWILPTRQYENVCVNEKYCHCDGQLVNLEQVEKDGEILVIGGTTEENQYYYFTKENSDLIELYEVRYRISISLYVFVFLCLCRMKKWKG